MSTDYNIHLLGVPSETKAWEGGPTLPSAEKTAQILTKQVRISRANTPTTRKASFSPVFSILMDSKSGF
jgi:hypothetical protein